MKTYLRVLVASALVLAACGGGTAATTTTAAPDDVTTAAGGPGDTTPDTTPDTTTPAAPTTIEQAPTTEAMPDVDADQIVADKTAAVEAAAPEGWTAMTGAQDDFNEGDDFVYEECTVEGEFDLDNLDSVSLATLLTSVTGPDDAFPFPAARGSIEARVLDSESRAEEVFAVFERLYGSEEGLACLTDVVLATLGDDVPTNDLNFEIEEASVEGSQAGARFAMTFNVEGFDGGVHIEFQGARMGACTVIASFVTFGEPLDRDIADALFSAAVNA